MEIAEKEKGKFKFSDIKNTTKKVMGDLGDGLEKIADDIKSTFKGRNHTLMVRVDKPTLSRIDELVETGFFSSRSEAAAFLLYEGISKQEKLFNQLRESTSKIKNIRESMREVVAKELKNDVEKNVENAKKKPAKTRKTEDS